MKSHRKLQYCTHLKYISPEYSLRVQILKLKLQYFGHQVRRTDSLGKTLMLGKIESRRRRGRQRMKWLDGIRFFEQVREFGTGQPGVLQSIGLERVRHD